MTTIVTRTGKGSPLTHVEVDTNFTNLNTAKLEAGAIALGSAAAPSISFTGDTNTGIFSPGADTLAFAEGGVEAMRIDSSGRLLVGTSTANTSGAKLQTVDGLTFPATQVASADANTLDDYEEGTFTPGISFGGGTAGISYTGGLVGTYVKIGRVVYVTVAVQAQSNGTSTGNLAITGLPFTAANTTGVFGLSGYGILAVSRDNGTNVITATSFSSSISSGATTIACFKTVSAITAPAANITDVDCGTLGNNYTASIYYYV
jgi:hypothetical protein